MAEDEKDKEHDWFAESKARVQELKDLMGQMRDGDGLAMKERLQRLKEIQERIRDTRPTPEDRERLLERLRQQHGDLPKKTLLQKAMGEVVANLGNTLEEMRRPSAQDLHGAIMVGDITEVRRLIAAGIDITARGATGHSPLGAATLHRQPEIVQTLREAGAPVGLWEAVALDEVETLRSLLDSGADPHSQQNGFTLLREAVSKGNPEMVRLLLERGADVNEGGTRGIAPLMSVGRNRPEIVALLRAAGAHVGLIEAIRIGDRARVLELLDSGADIEEENSVIGLTPLMAAAGCGDLELLRLLLARGADLHRVSSRHFTALTQAISGDQRATVNFLLDAGMDLNAPGFVGNEYMGGHTPIFHAIQIGHQEMMRLLIARGARLDVRDVRGETPLHWAADSRGPEAMEILLDAGVEMDAVDSRGWTPLMRVAFRILVPKDVHAAFMRLLIARGADVNIHDAEGRTILMMAAGHNNPELVEMLLDAGAEIDAVDNLGFSALTAPVLEQRDEIIALLKARGAKPRKRVFFPDDEDETPP
ncbi:MAG: ankyrin repeat and protein 1 isoform [Chthonomonadaceae bacterium]|nr:ankyrin repeat and protein 1 isoform [Chthonomonadaceae bacterium]